MGAAASTCPNCARPIAVARAACVYCGAALSPEAVAAAQESAARVASRSGFADAARAAGDFESTDRLCVVIRAEATDASTLSRAFSLSAWEAQQWRTRGAYRLVRVAPAEAARSEAERLRASGVPAWTLGETDARRALDPQTAEEVDLSGATPVFTVRARRDADSVRRPLEPADVLLVVSGPIQRERLRATDSLKRPGLDRLEDGFRAHLHLVAEPAPIELDPRRVAVRSPAGASAMVVVRELARRLGGAGHDENFRFEVPVMSESDERSDERLARERGGDEERKASRSTILDNVKQFRSYSGWRGAVERLSRETLRTAS